MRSWLRFWAVMLLQIGAAGTSWADSTPVADRVEPTAQGQFRPNESAFRTYQPFVDQPVLSWPQANAQVQAIGGWRAYAKEVYRARAAKPLSQPGQSSKP